MFINSKNKKVFYHTPTYKKTLLDWSSSSKLVRSIVSAKIQLDKFDEVKLFHPNLSLLSVQALNDLQIYSSGLRKELKNYVHQPQQQKSVLLHLKVKKI
jgi:hypothetical protein